MKITNRMSLALMLLWTILLSSCGDRENRERAVGMSDSPPASNTTAMVPDTTAGATTAGDLTDANIVALLDHANVADSSAGSLASTKATNPQVKQFARLMMAEHHALRKEGQALAKKLNITPEPPANDPVTPLATKEMEALKSAQKGAEFDRTYMEQEITAHQAVLDLAEQSHEAADNAELKALIEKARPVIEKHLKQAQDIEKSLSTSA
jgi:putative membrane protein